MLLCANRYVKKFARVNFLQRANLCFFSLLYLFSNFYPPTYFSFLHVQWNKLLEMHIVGNESRTTIGKRIIYQIYEFKSNKICQETIL